MNGDGLDDLVARYCTAPNICGTLVYLARGSGYFEAGAKYPYLTGDTVNRPGKPVDADNDGDLDLIITASEGIYVAMNLGNGTFTHVVMSPGITPGALSDVTGDGLVDIITGGDPIRVFPNLGGGQFGAALTSPGFANAGPMAGDMDGDGDQDLVLIRPQEFRVFSNQSNGTFIAGTWSYSMYTQYADGVIVDHDGDGDNDLVMTDTALCGLRIRLNPGNGAFPATYGDGPGCTVSDSPQYLVAADFDNDGLPEYASTFGDEFYVTINGTSYFVGDKPGIIKSGDFDGDGDFDVIAVGNYAWKVMMNDGTGQFPTTNTSAIIELGSAGFFAAADVNNDGAMDIIHTNSNGIRVRTGLGDGTFNAPVDYPTSSGASKIVAADINGDGKPDLAVAHGTGTTVSILLNQGNGTFAPKVDYAPGSSPRGLALEDVNGDNVRDMIVHSSSGVTVHINQGNGTFGPTTSYTIGSLSEISVFDFNDDGWHDIFVAPAASGNPMALGTLINQGNGSFVQGADITLVSKPIRLAKADLDGNGRVDLVMRHDDHKHLSILYNQGNGTFQVQIINHTDYSAYGRSALGIGDMNRDGIPDIITGQTTLTFNEFGMLDVLINQGNGTTFEMQQHAVGGNSLYTTVDSPVVAADFTGDGNLDLAFMIGSKLHLHFNTCLP